MKNNVKRAIELLILAVIAVVFFAACQRYESEDNLKVNVTVENQDAHYEVGEVAQPIVANSVVSIWDYNTGASASASVQFHVSNVKEITLDHRETTPVGQAYDYGNIPARSEVPAQISVTPSTDEEGIYYYYVVHTLNEPNVSDSGCGNALTYATTLSAHSQIITITVGDVEVEEEEEEDEEEQSVAFAITAQPQAATYNLNDTAQPLTAAVSVNKNTWMDYAWYADGVMIGEETRAFSNEDTAFTFSYTPPTNTVGEVDYHLVVYRQYVGDAGIVTETLTSDVATVTVNSSAINFAITAQPTGGTYTAGSNVALSVAAITNSGNALRYQWFTNLANSAEGAVAIQGATSNTFNVNTSNNSNQYYYCRVTDTHNGQTHTLQSNIVNVSVTGTKPAPVVLPEIYVIGTQVTQQNKDDVLGDGHVSYNSDTNVLTVDFDGMGGAVLGNYALASSTGNAYKDAVIGANADITLNLIGDSSVGMSIKHDHNNNQVEANTIKVNGNLTITGDAGGALGATSPVYINKNEDASHYNSAHGIDVSGDITINMTGKLHVYGACDTSTGFNAFNASGSISILGGEITANGNGSRYLAGLYSGLAYNKVPVIYSGATVKASADPAVSLTTLPAPYSTITNYEYVEITPPTP